LSHQRHPFCVFIELGDKFATYWLALTLTAGASDRFNMNGIILPVAIIVCAAGCVATGGLTA
jgi:hypothetical protein